MLILFVLVISLLGLLVYHNKEMFISYGDNWAPSLPENLEGAANHGPHGRSLNAYDFEASQERKVDSDGTPINAWYETKDVSLVQDPILNKEDWDYLQGGDYYEYWYNKPWMTYKRYQEALENKQMQQALSGNKDRFPRIYCNNGWYEANTCGGLPAYEGTYLYGEPNSVGNRITFDDLDDPEEDAGQDYTRSFAVQPIETTGCADSA